MDIGKLLFFFLTALLVFNTSLICMAENNVLYSTVGWGDLSCLHNGAYLAAGQYLNNNNDVLVMQSDCNLVLYRSGSAIWSSGTRGKGSNCIATLQFDGNLVISQGGTQIWSTNIKGTLTGNYVLHLQNDGNLVIYGSSLWATGTNKRPGERKKLN